MSKKLRSLLVFLFCLVWFAFFRPTFLGGRTSFIIVSGISMEPTMYTGDLAVLLRQNEYHPGDVISFRVPGGNVIHRVVGGDGQTGYLTQGDNKTDIDPWTPTHEQVLGKMWFFIPKAGRFFDHLRQPKGLAMITTLAAFFILDEPKKLVKIRKRGRRMKVNTSALTGWIGPSLLMSLLGVFGSLAMLFLGAAGYAFLSPMEKMEKVERLSYDHTASFRYTVHTTSSKLYPEGIVGPIDASQAAQESQDGEGPAGKSVFARFVRSIDLNFNYRLVSDPPAKVQGNVKFHLMVRSGNLWEKSFPLGAPVAFNGDGVETQVAIDLEPIQAEIEALEEEIGFNPGAYEVMVIPTVQWAGEIGEQVLQSSYAPSFRFDLNANTLDFTPTLETWKTETVNEMAVMPQYLKLWVFSAPVERVRWVGSIVGLVCLLLSGLLTAMVYAGVAVGEAASLQARYGSLMVNVDGRNFANEEKVQVTTMQDLARLAQRNGAMILHQALGNGAHLYFVPDGPVVYQYRSEKPIEEA